jgi:mono/diheme cytochrome c family protein
MRRETFRSIVVVACAFTSVAWGATVQPRDALPVDPADWPAEWRLHVEFSGPTGGALRLTEELSIPLTGHAVHDVALESPASGPPVLRVWSGGELVRGPEEVPALATRGASDHPEAAVSFSGDFTASVGFQTTGSGTLFAKSPPTGAWQPNAKALFIAGGHLVYDVGWLGAVRGGPRVDDGKPHTAVLVQRDGRVRLWLDGKIVGERAAFARPDVAGHILRIGRASDNFGGDFKDGAITAVQVWQRALPEAEIQLLFKDGGVGANTPDFNHLSGSSLMRPLLEPAPGTRIAKAWVQPLQNADHAEIVANWNETSLEKGRQIYASLCVVCHGTQTEPGSLPTATAFAGGEFKNGSDPYSMFVTLSEGYGQMVAQPQYTTAQKYAVIQYIREAYLRPHHEAAYRPLTPDYLATLPKGRALAEAEVEDRSLPPFKRMDFGPALFWTYQIEPGNIAQKGLALRLDAGPGGISKGKAWMVYDHDTLRVAAATTGEFVDWRGIAFDGSHGTHTSLAGERHLVLPVGPGWASPAGDWADPRPLAKDGRPFGPLPREWAHFRGMKLHGQTAVLLSTVGGAPVLESPAWLDYGTTPVFIRTLNIGAASKPLLLRVAPESAGVALAGDGSLRRQDGFWVAELPGGAMTRLFVSRADAESLAALAKAYTEPLDLAPLTQGGPPRWPEVVTTTSQEGPTGGAFVADTFPLPLENPWQAWLRPGGFDFTPDGQAAIVAMWNGDVWRVDGIKQPAPAELRWRRIATGLFQPLGVKFRGDELFITCRDQLARLHDLNGNGEIDFIESFNNDHHVTEHFHEFAMGLQTDAEGNFYYAKSARHALDSLVPHHGTLLRVSADGARTDILATGFRAANGVCLNDDGSFFVTDQEGHWMPKNRINRVTKGGFYGNMYGYTDVKDTSDDAMEPPMVWITNDKDRSPAELLWVPENAWGPFGGSLLNLSYGTGKVFLVPHEDVGGVWQGAVCELPMPAFATGIMRGRFGDDGALYACGMFAWAGNAVDPGGLHRIRHSGAPAAMPLAVRAVRGGLILNFSEPLDPAAISPSAFAFKIWSAKRSAGYGSPHLDERPLEITGAKLNDDRRSITLTVPQLTATQFYELTVKLPAPDGGVAERTLHGTIHQLSEQ